MYSIRDRDGPQNEKGPRRAVQSFAATPEQEERGLPLAFYHGNASGQEDATSLATGLAGYTDGQVQPSTFIATFELDPGPYFKEAKLNIFGAPDDGRRARLVFDLLWGRWAAKPPEEDDFADEAGVAMPELAWLSGLTGGADVEGQAQALAA